MVIQKGHDWGATGALGPSGIVVRDDREARRLIEQAMRSGLPVPEIGLLGGDLARTLGGRPDERRLRSSEARRLPIDLGAAMIDGRPYWFISHLVAHRRLWTGRFIVMMNAQWIGDWNMAPRAHPNDGRLEIIDGALSIGDRLKARRRLPAGSHLPHPDLSTLRAATYEVAFDRPLPVELDGESVGLAQHLLVTLKTDAITVVV